MRPGANRPLAALALGAVLLAGCGGGGSGGGSTPTPTSPAPFEADAVVAVAGEDVEVSALGGIVTLDGRKSVLRDTATGVTGTPSSFLWELVSQPGASLAAFTSPQALTTVAFPASVSSGAYVFRLTVTGAGGLFAADTMQVDVKPFVIQPIADRIAIGLSVPGLSTVTASFAATVTGTVSGGLTFSWAGAPVAPFARSVSGASTTTLTLTAPSLEEVEKAPALPTILGMWARAGGFYRLTVTATDGAGARDSEDVIVSYAVPTSGLANVPKNVPVYLNGGASSTNEWTWAVASQPAGPAVVLRRLDFATVTQNATTDQRYVQLVPAVEGLYILVGTRKVTSGAVVTTATKVFELNVATYVSDGLRAAKAPNPDLGHCAGCHGGSIPFLADKVTPYLGTKHAALADAIFDPANVTAQARLRLSDLAPELSYVTTGFYPSAVTASGASDGFDDVAARVGVSHRGLTKAELLRRFPDAGRLADTQCESCHGPGSLHFGDSEAIAVNILVDTCARCHVSQPQQWAESAHAQVVASPSGNTACVRCHAAGAALDSRATSFRYSTNPALPNTPPSLTIPNEDGRMNTATCATCHDPHDASGHAQLRVTGDVVLPNGRAVAAGDSASCFQCHNSRKSPSLAGDLANRSAPHHPVQGEMLVGSNGVEFAGRTYANAPHGDSRFRFDDGTPGRACVTCHMSASPGAGDPDHDAVGGHSFRMRSAVTGNVLTGACLQCHTVGTETRTLGDASSVRLLATLSAADWDGDGKSGRNASPSLQETVQDEVSGLLQVMGGAVTTTASNPFGVDEEPDDPGSSLVRLAQSITSTARAIRSSSGAINIVHQNGTTTRPPATARGTLLYQAAWNYYFVIYDGSYGIHNHGYAVTLLQGSIREIERELSLPAKSFEPFTP